MEVLQTSPCHMAMGTTGWCRLEMGVYRRTDSPTENLCSRDVLDVESGTTGHHGVLVLLEILYIPKPARSFSCHLTVQLLFSEGSSSFSSTLHYLFSVLLWILSYIPYSAPLPLWVSHQVSCQHREYVIFIEEKTTKGRTGDSE